MDLNSLAIRLEHFRLAKGLTKYALAKSSVTRTGKHLSQTYIYRIEKGEIKNPRRDTLQALAHGLGITVAQLIGDVAPFDSWGMLEQTLNTYVPVYASVQDTQPIDFVAVTRAKMPSTTMRAYRANTLYLHPNIRPNDTLIVDTALKPKNGDLVIAIKERHSLVAKYNQDRYGYKWIEDNHAHHDLNATRIHAVITDYIHSLR